MMNWQTIDTYSENVVEGNSLFYNERTGGIYVGRYEKTYNGFRVFVLQGKSMDDPNPTHWCQIELPKRRYDRDSIWKDHFGNKRKIRDLDDTHIANIIKWFPKSHLRKELALFEVIMAELEIRGLSKDFLGSAYIPYKGPDGEWYLNMEKVSNKKG